MTTRSSGSRSAVPVVVPLAIVILAALLLPKLWLAETPLYQGILTPHVLLVVTALAKLAFLVTATVLAARVGKAFGRPHPSGNGWRLMTAGFAACTGAQAVLVWYQLVLRVPSPYPSAADPLFVAGMLLLAAALFGFLRAYTRSELPLTSRREVLTLVAFTAPLLVALGATLLRPVLASPAPLLEQALNVAYPLLDCLLLVPTLVLARVTSRLRGGAVHRVWTVLLAGFLCTAAGDVAFAYFSTLGMERLDPLVDLLFAASYGLWAWGAGSQHALVATGGP
jgi:hypothetical protein